MYTTSNNQIIVPESELDLATTLNCGQFFRSERLGEGYKVFSGEYECFARTANGNVYIDTNNVEFFIRFFDLERDVARIRRELYRFEELRPMLSASGTLRILRQPLFETIITFVISANNNMPRIKSIVKHICAQFDNAFPTPSQLSTLNERQLQSLGCGYRTPYIIYNSELCATTDILKRLEGAYTNDALKILQMLKGVGPKVADCIALFALGRYDVCPVDTWILNKQRIGSENERQVRERLINRYGDNAGYAQQIIYNYYAIHKNQ